MFLVIYERVTGAVVTLVLLAMVGHQWIHAILRETGGIREKGRRPPFDPLGILPSNYLSIDDNYRLPIMMV